VNNIDLFLVQYGLAALFIVLFLKTIGVPIPVPVPGSRKVELWELVSQF
jgi:hypothetical protein